MASSGKANKIEGNSDPKFEKNVKNPVSGENKAPKKKEKLPTLTHPEQNLDLLKNKGVSVVAFLDTVRGGRKGTSTVRIQIIHKRYPKHYTTKVQMLPEDWMKMLGLKPRGDLKEKKILVHETLRKVLTIIYSMEEFSFEGFEKLYIGEQKTKDDVAAAYDRYIKELKESGRLGSQNFYTYSRDSVMKFVGEKRLSFKSINIQFLKKYEAHMLLKGDALTTVAMYLRCLRYLYNNAIKDGIVKPEDYPFGRGKYEIPQPQNIKKALKLSDIGKLFNYQPESEQESYYRDIWMFSYLCNGINLKDICLLKYQDFQGDHIYFRRAKTKNTNRNSKPIDIIVTDEVRQIIERWGNKPVQPDTFIFPVLINGLTAEKQHAYIAQAVQMTNRYIRRIAKKIGIEANITTYTARHSFATVLKRSGVNVTYISEALGHSDIKTTENYLDSFEDEQKKEIAKKLTAW